MLTNPAALWLDNYRPNAGTIAKLYHVLVFYQRNPCHSAAAAATVVVPKSLYCYSAHGSAEPALSQTIKP
jgi:hypothetical protein